MTRADERVRRGQSEPRSQANGIGVCERERKREIERDTRSTTTMIIIMWIIGCAAAGTPPRTVTADDTGIESVNAK